MSIPGETDTCRVAGALDARVTWSHGTFVVTEDRATVPAPSAGASVMVCAAGKAAPNCQAKESDAGVTARFAPVTVR